MKYMILIIAFFGLLFWLLNIPNTVHISMLDYTVETSLPKLLIFLCVIIVPCVIILNIFNRIVRSIKHDRYLSTIVNFIKELEDVGEKFTIISLLKNSSKNSFIKKFKEALHFINNKQYDKAIKVINTITITKQNEEIITKYLCKIYHQQQDIANLLTYCKKGIALKQDIAWFIKYILPIVVKKHLINELPYLDSAVNTLKLNNPDNCKCFCLIKYYYAKDLYQKNKDQANKLCLQAIKIEPTFVPAYSILIDIYALKGDNHKITDTLHLLWSKTQSYEALLLWKKHYTETDDKKITETVKRMLSTSQNIEMNYLLEATISIKNNKLLEAYEVLQKIKTHLFYKNLVEIELMKKDKNYKNINQILDSLANKSAYLSSWWTSYINFN